MTLFRQQWIEDVYGKINTRNEDKDVFSAAQLEEVLKDNMLKSFATYEDYDNYQKLMDEIAKELFPPVLPVQNVTVKEGFIVSNFASPQEAIKWSITSYSDKPMLIQAQDYKQFYDAISTMVAQLNLPIKIYLEEKE